MENLKNYVEENLSNEAKTVLSSWRNDVLVDYLDLWEKTIIYKYSNDAFKELNETLRINKGFEIPEFGKFLKFCIDKLPDFKDIVYRGVNLSKNEIEKYFMAYQEKSILTENSFISATKSKSIAYQHGSGIFRIISKRGKDIAILSKYPKEQEILFCCNSNFKVLTFAEDIYGNGVFITLKEI